MVSQVSYYSFASHVHVLAINRRGSNHSLSRVFINTAHECPEDMMEIFPVIVIVLYI